MSVARRRALIAVLLLLLSVGWLAGAWAWILAQVEVGRDAGVDPVVLQIDASGRAYVATWIWVVGAVVVHALVAGFAAWRRDRGAVQGAAISAVLHLVWMVAQGVLAPPG